MEIPQIVLGIILFFLAIALGVYTCFAARCKGPIFTNTFIWSSPQERKKANIRAEYHQAAIVFGCLSMICCLLAVYVLAHWQWLFVLMWLAVFFTVVYAIVSSIKMKKRGN